MKASLNNQGINGIGTQKSSAFGNSYLFTGRRLDESTDLYYYRNRYYNAKNGCFMGRDPEGYVDGMNSYFYLKNSPLNAKDPLGLFIFGGGIEGAIGGGILGLEGSIDLVVDSNGDYGLAFSGSVLIGPQGQASIGIGPMISTVDTVDDLNGLSYGAWASGDVGVGLGVDVEVPQGTDEKRIYVSSNGQTSHPYTQNTGVAGDVRVSIGAGGGAGAKVTGTKAVEIPDVAVALISPGFYAVTKTYSWLKGWFSDE
jgi:RHS repeat-associated protein